MPPTPQTKAAPVDSITGIGPTYRERLASVGIYSVDELAGADAATVAAESDISQGRVAQWVERANDR